MITSKKYSGLNIWPKTPNQGIASKNMIITIKYNEAKKQKEINLPQ